MNTPSRVLRTWSTTTLKNTLNDYYYILSLVSNSKDEKKLDEEIHRIKAVLEGRGIYTREKIVPIFVLEQRTQATREIN